MFKKIQTYISIFSYFMVDMLIPPVILISLHSLLLTQPVSDIYFKLASEASMLLVLGMILKKGYSRYKERSIAEKLDLVFTVWIGTVFLLFVLAFLNLTSDQFSRKVVVAWVVITPIALLVARLWINRNVVHKFLQPTKVVLFKKYEFTQLEKKRLENQKVELSLLGEGNSLTARLRETHSKMVVLNTYNLSEELIRELTRLELQGISIVGMEQFMEHYLRKCYVDYDSQKLEFVNFVFPYSRINYVIKRFIDIVLSLVLFLFSLPIMLLAVYKIKRESPGSVIFRQIRVGLNGSDFTVYKFRSMHENIHFNPYTEKGDSRVFPFGKTMRKMRVDELPQLWNVLKGDMHLFGPRSEWDILVEKYEKKIPYYHERHLVAPGISGWAQVMYPYGLNTEDARQKLMYDLYYIKNWNIWLEFETILRTVAVVLGKKGI